MNVLTVLFIILLVVIAVTSIYDQYIFDKLEKEREAEISERIHKQLYGDKE